MRNRIAAISVPWRIGVVTVTAATAAAIAVAIGVVIFVVSGASAQGGNIPGEVVVTRLDTDTYQLSSSSRVCGGADCRFGTPVGVLGAEGGSFPLLGEVGEVQPDGTLLADRTALIDLLASDEAKFVVLTTSCGSNAGDLGAKGFLNRIERLEVGESATIQTTYVN